MQFLYNNSDVCNSVNRSNEPVQESVYNESSIFVRFAYHNAIIMRTPNFFVKFHFHEK